MNGSLLMLGLAGPELTPAEALLFSQLQPAGYVLLARNFVSAEQTRRLTDSLRKLSRSHPLIATAQDGGGLPAGLPSPAALAAHGNAKATGTAGLLTGELLRMLGINLLLAPTLDLDHFPEAPGGRADRRWGCDPQRVIDHAGQWNRWLRKRGVASCAKHFPGGGRALEDPNHERSGSPATVEELLREDLLPYTALMPELDAIMTGHLEFAILDPGLPASLSTRVVRRLLRDQLGFDHHLVLTDDLDHAAITRRVSRGPDARLALEAGNDLALICQRPHTAPAAVEAIRTLPTQVLAEAWERVERMRDKLHWPLPWSAAKWEETQAKIALLAETADENAD